MTLQASGPLSMSDINIEKGLAGNTANSSLAALSTTNITAASASKPDQAAPHGMAEFYSYNHTAATPPSLSAYAMGTSSAPGDGGGYVEATFTIADGVGGEYVMLEGVVASGDPITNTGFFGGVATFTTSPAQEGVAIGSGANGSCTLKLYTSGGVLLGTYTVQSSGIYA